MKKILFVITFVSLLFKTHFYVISDDNKNIDPRLLKYYDSFVFEGAIRGIELKNLNIHMRFKETSIQKRQALALEGKSELGHCKVIIGQDPEINIDPVQWNLYSEVQREIIIYHELSHCFLLKGHTSSMHNGIYTSIMNPTIFDQRIYIQNKKYYIDELFSYKPYHMKDYVDTFFFGDKIKKVF